MKNIKKAILLSLVLSFSSLMFCASTGATSDDGTSGVAADYYLCCRELTGVTHRVKIENSSFTIRDLKENLRLNFGISEDRDLVFPGGRRIYDVNYVVTKEEAGRIGVIHVLGESPSVYNKCVVS